VFNLGKRRKATGGPRIDQVPSHDAGEQPLHGGTQAGKLAEFAGVHQQQALPHYFMDSPTEGDRLELKTDPFVVGQQLLRAGLRVSMRALDLACGTGAVTRVMAKIAGNACVTGLDMSTARLEQARILAQRDGVEVDFVQGEVQELPFPDDAFKFTHARFLFQYLSEPQAALREMVRVTRPNGSVVVADLDGQITRLYPMDETLSKDVRDALRMLAEYGFDPHVGRKLFRWFREAGMVNVKVTVEPYQVYYGGLPERDTSNWQEKLATSTAFLIKQSGDHRRWERFRKAYLEALTSPDALYYSTVVLVRGTVPA